MGPGCQALINSTFPAPNPAASSLLYPAEKAVQDFLAPISPAEAATAQRRQQTASARDGPSAGRLRQRFRRDLLHGRRWREPSPLRNTGPPAPGEAAEAARGKGASANPRLPDLPSRGLGCTGRPGSQGPIHPKGCPRASPQLGEGRHSTAGAREQAAAGKPPTAFHTRTGAARPQLSPARLPRAAPWGHLRPQSPRASPSPGILFTHRGPCFWCACEIVSNVTPHYRGYNESLLKWI